MGLIQKYYSPEIDFLIWELERKNEETIYKLLELLDCSKYNKQLSSIKTLKRKIEFLASRYLLKLLFNTCVTVDYKPEGSPYIKNSSWKISITHSGSYVAIARSKYTLGIDIEQISDKLERTKHKFSSERELSFIDKTQNLYQLCLYWSAKESVYKLVGDEALIFDEEMMIEKFQPKQEGIFGLELNSTKQQARVDIHYRRIKDYVFTYAVHV